MQRIAILCASTRSIYHAMQNVDVYDKRRDVRTFQGGLPVVAHPPCRSWSAYCAHQSKPEPGEKELGPLCVDWLRKCGGVLEHPAHSRLFDACDIPKPGEPERRGLWSMAVLQAWWGDSRRKSTWLAFCGVKPTDIEVPFVLRFDAGDRRRWQLMSKSQRSATVPAFAEWLVNAARVSEVAK